MRRAMSLAEDYIHPVNHRGHAHVQGPGARENPDFGAAVREVGDDFLPDGDVTIDVDHSTLNYKDDLAITNRSPVVRSWPMVAGIDGAGTVVDSTNASW